MKKYKIFDKDNEEISTFPFWHRKSVGKVVLILVIIAGVWAWYLTLN